VVALGGGTGLPAVLRGLRERVECSEPTALTGIVAMSDDGGSSGRLRRSRGVPPPGDVRNCLVALSAEEDLLAGLFQHRYEGEPELGGHNLGNLILAALAEQTGSFLKAVEVSSRVLRTVGRILPVTLEDVSLAARLADGSRLLGESAIGSCGRPIAEISLRPAAAQPTPGVVQAILEADLIVIGPGSLFTSIVPTLVLEPVARAMRETRAVRVLVGNLVSDPRECPGLGLADHVGVLERHAGSPIVDALLVHEGPIDVKTLRRYRAEDAEPLGVPQEGRLGVQVFRRRLVATGPKLRHDPLATAEALLEVWRLLGGAAERPASPREATRDSGRPEAARPASGRRRS
jgi:uncharacterized cofD-like protein